MIDFESFIIKKMNEYTDDKNESYDCMIADILSCNYNRITSFYGAIEKFVKEGNFYSAYNVDWVKLGIDSNMYLPVTVMPDQLPYYVMQCAVSLIYKELTVYLLFHHKEVRNDKELHLYVYEF